MEEKNVFKINDDDDDDDDDVNLTEFFNDDFLLQRARSKSKVVQVR